MLHTILARTITGINKELASINYGGCGHYAYELNQALAVHDIHSAIVLVDQCYDERDVESFIKYMNGAHDISSALRIRFANGVTNGSYANPCFGHICLKVDDILYDADGIHHARAISEGIEPDAMALALQADCWNNTFEWNNDTPFATMKAYIEAALAPLSAH